MNFWTINSFTALAWIYLTLCTEMNVNCVCDYVWVLYSECVFNANDWVSTFNLRRWRDMNTVSKRTCVYVTPISQEYFKIFNTHPCKFKQILKCLYNCLLRWCQIHTYIDWQIFVEPYRNTYYNPRTQKKKEGRLLEMMFLCLY